MILWHPLSVFCPAWLRHYPAVVECLLTKGGAHWFLFQIQNHDKLDRLAVLQIPTHLHVKYTYFIIIVTVWHKKYWIRWKYQAMRENYENILVVRWKVTTCERDHDKEDMGSTKVQCAFFQHYSRLALVWSSLNWNVHSLYVNWTKFTLKPHTAPVFHKHINFAI